MLFCILTYPNVYYTLAQKVLLHLGLVEANSEERHLMQVLTDWLSNP